MSFPSYQWKICLLMHSIFLLYKKEYSKTFFHIRILLTKMLFLQRLLRVSKMAKLLSLNHLIIGQGWDQVSYLY